LYKEDDIKLLIKIIKLSYLAVEVEEKSIYYII